MEHGEQIQLLTFEYVNHEGKKKLYSGYPLNVLYRASKWYPDDGLQWYIDFDISRDGKLIKRGFQLRRIVFV
jgi:hypothetical protein